MKKTPRKKAAKKSVGPQLIKSLRGLRDTLASGKRLSDVYRVTSYPVPKKAAKKAKRRTQVSRPFPSMDEWNVVSRLRALESSVATLTERLDLQAQSIAALPPKSDALPPPDAAKGLREVVMKGINWSTDGGMVTHCLLAAAALCRHRAESEPNHYLNRNLKAFAADLDAAAGGAG